MAEILIIEDESDIAKVLFKRLSQNGFKVIVASDGYRGTAMAIKNKPDLIILDLMLPSGDGLFVLKNLRNSDYTKFIPIVVLTGQKDEDYKKKVLEEGVDAYMEKPYAPNELINTIKYILETYGKDEKEQ